MRPVTPQETAVFGARVRATVKQGIPGILGGAISNIVGPFTDAEWKELMDDAARPCDQPGCDCHVVRPIVMAGLDAARKDWRTIQARLS